MVYKLLILICLFPLLVMSKECTILETVGVNFEKYIDFWGDPDCTKFVIEFFFFGDSAVVDELEYDFNELQKCSSSKARKESELKSILLKRNSHTNNITKKLQAFKDSGILTDSERMFYLQKLRVLNLLNKLGQPCTMQYDCKNKAFKTLLGIAKEFQAEVEKSRKENQKGSLGTLQLVNVCVFYEALIYVIVGDLFEKYSEDSLGKQKKNIMLDYAYKTLMNANNNGQNCTSNQVKMFIKKLSSQKGSSTK